MTGTADTEAEEFHKIYKLDVVIIPTNLSMVRRITGRPRLQERGAEVPGRHRRVAECYERGQPVLVGTISVEKSEVLSACSKAGIPHNVLNAKSSTTRAKIVAQAGRQARWSPSDQHGRSWNRHPARWQRRVHGANRGLRRRDGPPSGCLRRDDAGIQRSLREVQRRSPRKKSQVVAAGGLHILGTERHESRRIDNQLRGRAGRQGDPGSSRFYPVARRRSVAHLRRRAHHRPHGAPGHGEDVPIEHRW